MDYETKRSYLEAINQYGTYTEAAKKLYVSQPYLSKVVKNLEDEANTLFFDKYEGKLKLSYAGRIYLRHITKIIDIEDGLSNELHMIADNRTGTIRIGINPALGGIILPNVLPSYRKMHPNINIELFETNGKELERLLEKSELDAAIGITPIENKNLSYEILFTDGYHLLVPKASALYREDSSDIIDFDYPISVLKNESFILMGKNFPMRRQIDQFFSLNQIDPTVTIETNTLITAISMSKYGMGCTFSPVASLGLISKTGFTIYRFPESQMNNTFVLMRNKNQALKKPVAVLMNMIRDYVKETYV